MHIAGIGYPPIMNASGTRGFFGEGYWYHKSYKYLGLNFAGCGFTAKTTTMQPRLNPEHKLGNMHMLADGITPKHYLPSCIIVKPIVGVALNAVGLSGPGAASLLERNMWQQISKGPWNLSFMSLMPTRHDRMDELLEFVQLLLPVVHQFRATVGLELNFSCPNTAIDPACLIDEVGEALTIALEVRIPLLCKFNALAPVATVCEISKHPGCDAIVMGNTLPWGSFSDRVHWETLFSSSRSPLEKFGGGGLSGPPLRAIHCEWIQRARELGIAKPIIGCGGIDDYKAVLDYRCAGASAIQIGTVCMVRPWRIKRIKEIASILDLW